MGPIKGDVSTSRLRYVCLVAMASALSSVTARLDAQATDLSGLIQSDQWLALGPFANPYGCSNRNEDILGNHLAPSCIHCLYPQEGDAIEYDPNQAISTSYLGPTNAQGQPFWRLFNDGLIDGDQDLNLDASMLGAGTDDVMTWLVTYVEYTGDAPIDITFCFGSDDGGQIWLDDQLVHNNNACRGRDNCQDQPAATITPGVHRIAAAAWDRAGDWGLRLSILVGGIPVIDDPVLFPEWFFLGIDGSMEPPPGCTCDISTGCTEYSISPRAAQLRVGDSVTLVPRARNDEGIPLRPQVSYSVAPEGIVTVDEDGLVTAVAEGEATITATCDGGGSLDVIVTVLDFIDLGNIAAGGNGIDPPPPGNIGINADLGTFVQARLNVDVPEANLINPMPVDGTNGADDSPFIDSVFIIDFGVGQTITTSGLTFDFEAGDVAGGWEAILDGREPGGPDFLAFGSQVYQRGVGLHAAQGITYDLEALRDQYGPDAVRFISAIAGEASGQVNGLVNTYLILSSEDSVLDFRKIAGAADRGEFVELAIPPEAIYATLAVGAAGNGIGSDHGAFGNAQITGTPIDKAACSEVAVDPSALTLPPGSQRQLTVTASDVFGLRANISGDGRASYSVAPGGIVTVSETGLVTAEARGEAEITITACGESVVVPVSVESFIDLGDVVAGGDGTGTGSFAAVNIDTGFFLDRATVDGLHADSIDADGINPSPVFDSDLIDSVFFLPGDFSPIHLEGVIFEFLLDETWTGSYNHILANKTHDIDKGIEDIIVGGVTFDAAIGIHASAGITFDLEALRDTHGESAVGMLHTFAGVDGCGGNISLYVIYSDEEGIIEDPNANDARGVWTVRVQAGSPAQEYLGEIPPEARYLSLVVGGRNGIGCAHGVFANPRIVPAEGGSEPGFVRGDADANGSLNLTDGIVVLNFLFVGGVAIPCQKAADADDTGALNLTDGIFILQYLFSGGTDIPEPFESCGPDPTPDGISCETPHCL